MPNYITPKELHKLTGIRLHRIYSWCKTKDFPAVSAGRTFIILEDEFHDWMMLRITKERKIMGLSKAQLGYKTEIHPSLIGKFEKGIQKPYKPARTKLESFFDIPINELFLEVD